MQKSATLKATMGQSMMQETAVQETTVQKLTVQKAMKRESRAVAGLLALVLASCVSGPGAGELVATPDPDWFVEDVQPVLVESCATSSCHGDPARPLELYAIHHNRLDETITHCDVPLTAEEERINFERTSAFVHELAWDGAVANDSALLHKPLDPNQGGSDHTGGVQFFDPTESDYIAVQAWIADAIGESP